MTVAHPAGISLLKVNNRNTTTRGEMCPKLTIKTGSALPAGLAFYVSNVWKVKVI